LIKQLGDAKDDSDYYIERFESIAGFKRLGDQTYIPALNK